MKQVNKKPITDIKALANYLQVKQSEAKELIDSGDYTIYSDSEANEAAKEYILNSAWAFNKNFIIGHCKALDFDKASESILDAIQEQCESGNDAILKLIDDEQEFVDDAIASDGRGHFLSGYDGNEIELENGNFAYRNN